jgi:MFS family permease
VRRGALVGGVVLVVVAAIVGGPVGALAALAGLAIAAWRGYRAVAAAALVALVIAAVLTVLEAPATGRAPDYLFDFALDRPLAADAGLCAGILLLVAVVLGARREREATSRIARPPTDQEHPDV